MCGQQFEAYDYSKQRIWPSLYNFPDDSPWEIQQGKTVPKYIEVEIGYQVIHSSVPELSTGLNNGFYGINRLDAAPSGSVTATPAS